MFLVSISINSYCQSLVYANYTVNDGLPGQTVYCALQDSKGFMWFSTDAGVTRFDGVHFKNYTRKDGLTDNEVFGINEDAAGRMWFLTFNGQLCYLKDERFHNPQNDSMMKAASASSSFFAFYQDNSFNVWFSTFAGTIIRIDTLGNVYKYQMPELNRATSFFHFYETPDNELWVIGDKNFFKFQKEEFVLLSGPVIKSGDGLAYNFISKGNALFLSTKGIERLINKDYGVIISSEKIPFTDKVLRLHYTSRNDIWVTNQKDQTLYYKYDNGTYLPYRVYLKGSAIIYVYTDHEANTWFCSAGNGVFKLPAQSFSNRSFTSSDGLSQDNLTSVKIANDSSIWLGFSNGIINRVKQNKIESFDCNFSGKNYNRILQIEVDRENNIWAATDDGVALIKKIYIKKFAPPFRVKINKSESFYSCMSLDFDSSGRLFAAWKSGLGEIQYTDFGYVLFPIKNKLPVKRIFTQFFDHNNKHWISTDEGLCTFEGDSLINYSVFDVRLKDRITHIKETSDNTLVLATYGNGILFLKDQKITKQIDITNGLSGSICKRLYTDGDTIYAATDKGLSIFVYKPTGNFNLENYTTSDGLLSNGVNDVCVKLNTVYVATSDGLSMLPISLNRNYTEPPPLYITAFKVNTTYMDSLQNIKLSYDRQYLQFSFVAPTFDHPELLTYQYKLTGLSESWSETKNNSVEFTALNPGVYIFQVRAKKYNSDWCKPEVLKFEIIAPFYESIWFQLVIANSLIILLYIILRNLVGRKFRKKLALYEQQRALQMERNRISTDMHDDLGADLTNIVILSKIAKKTLKIENDQNKIVDKIGIAANDVINKMNEIIWAMNPANDTLSNLISYLHRYSKEYLDLNDIKVHIEMPYSVPEVSLKAAYRRNIFLILKESLHNIVKHAKTSNVIIKIELDPILKKLLLTIQDNGKGFSVSEQTGSGNGLINMQKRMTEIKGNIHMISSVGKGTTINVTAPF